MKKFPKLDKSWGYPRVYLSYYIVLERPLRPTWSQLARQHARSNGACWRASTLQQVLLTHSPVRSDFCHSPRRHPVRLRRWLPNTSRHFFIPFKLQFIHLMVFYSYIRTLKCIMSIRAVIKACKNLHLYLCILFCF